LYIKGGSYYLDICWAGKLKYVSGVQRQIHCYAPDGEFSRRL